MKVLIVEDNKYHLAILVEDLDKSGRHLTPLAASSVAEGIQAADNEHPKVILLDVRLGGDSYAGMTVAKHVRRQSYGKAVYIIALTSHALPSTEEYLLENGFDKVVPKPYDVDELLRMIVEQPPSDAVEMPLSGAAGLIAPRAKLDQALHDLRELILIEKADTISEDDKVSVADQLREFIEALGVEPSADTTFNRREPDTTAKSLLIVENDPGQQLKLQEQLTDAGYEVSIVGDIFEAKLKVGTRGFDGYVIDYYLGEKGHETGDQLIDPPNIDQHNVIFMSISSMIVKQLRSKGWRVWDKQNADLLRLTGEIAPVQSNGLSSEPETRRRGETLIKNIKRALRRERGTAVLDSVISPWCQEFVTWVIKNRAPGIDKYVMAMDILTQCVELIDGPSMKESRRVCLQSHSMIYERWLFVDSKRPDRKERRFKWFNFQRVKWFGWKTWGVTTGYGNRASRIGALFAFFVALCAVLMTWKPAIFRFKINDSDLASVAGVERLWSSIYIAGCHALLVSPDTGAPLSTQAQAMVLVQTMASVVLLTSYVGVITSRITQDR